MRQQSVYLIYHAGLFRIGISNNPYKRLWEVVPAGTCDAYVVHHFPSANPRALERALHQRFGSRRVTRDWFRLDSSEVEEICHLTRVDDVEDLPTSLHPHRFFTERARLRLLPDDYSI